MIKKLSPDEFIEAAYMVQMDVFAWPYRMRDAEWCFYDSIFNNDGLFFGPDRESRIIALCLCAAIVENP